MDLGGDGQGFWFHKNQDFIAMLDGFEIKGIFFFWVGGYSIFMHKYSKLADVHWWVLMKVTIGCMPMPVFI